MTTTTIIFFLGILSAAGPTPTNATLALRQEWGQVPQDVSGYALIAVDDCGLIGHPGHMYAGNEVYPVIVYDCAGEEGTQYFSNGNDDSTPYKLSADAGWDFWKAHPDVVTSLVRIEIEVDNGT